jgi:hypothetical protein
MATDDLTPERARDRVTTAAERLLARFNDYYLVGRSAKRQGKVGKHTPEGAQDARLVCAELFRLRARLATVTAQRDALVPLARWAVVERNNQEGDPDGELDRLPSDWYAGLAAVAAIRAERATTGGTDADA